MKKDFSFYVLYPKSQYVRQLLNALKLVCDYKQRTEAHITVRGPYKKAGDEVIDVQNLIIKGSYFIYLMSKIFSHLLIRTQCF